MSRRAGPSFLLLTMALLGCGHRERGRFAVVAAETPAWADVLSNGSVTGRACFGAGAEFEDDHVIDAAVRDALARVPGADGLMNALIVDEGNCIRVEGTAVRVGAR